MPNDGFAEMAAHSMEMFRRNKIPVAVVQGVAHEAEIAVRQHKSDPDSARRYIIAMEEVGEVAQAMLEGDANQAIIEAEQTAAMFMRLSAQLRKEQDEASGA